MWHSLGLGVKRHVLWWSPVLAFLLALAMLQSGWDAAAAAAGGIALLTATWWIFEPIPLAATSLIPLGCFPLFGVLTGQQVALAYGDPVVLFLLSAGILSKALEKSGAHRRIALAIVAAIGGSSSRRVVIGFMVATAGISMWLSNTATAFMLLPVAIAVIEKAEDPKLAIPLLLGIAYAASIGGMGTLVGSPPNLIFVRLYEESTGLQSTFSEWFTWGLPVVLLMLPLTALWLTRNLRSGGAIVMPPSENWSQAEIRVLVVYACTILTWITFDEPFSGWPAWFDVPYANLASVTLFACVVLFLIPDGEGGHLLDWDTAASIDWGVFILFASGVAIASAFTQTGISAAMGEALGSLAYLHPLVVILIICAGVTFLTEVTSNTATATMLMPILAAAAMGAGMDPRLLMVPAALSASCAFMLPVATPPNAIVFSANRMTVKDMAREGFGLNLIGIMVISSVVYAVISLLE